MNIQKKLLAVALASAFAHSAQAADKYWACGSGTWNTACWSATFGGAATASLPAGSDNVILRQSDATNRTVNYVNTVMFLNSLTIDATGTGTMTLAQTQDHMGVSSEIIGFNGSGTYIQSGGTNAATSLTLGLHAGSVGTYVLSGSGDLSGASSTRTIGASGTGVFTQSGGTHSASSIVLGRNAGGSGTYTLSGGTLTADGVSVGSNGTGTFNQSGGNLNGLVTINSGSVFNQSGGVRTGNVSVGSGGAYLLNSGTSSGSVGGSGVFTMNGGTLNASGSLAVSTFNYNNGVLNLPGSINANTFNLGVAAGSNSIVTLASHQNLTADSLTIGNVGGTGSGTLIQNGGTSVVGALTINTGSYKLTGGALTTTSSLVNHGTLTFAGGASLTSTGAFTQGATGSFSGRGLVNGIVSNAGTINAKSGNLTFNGGSFTNTGLVKNSVGSNLFVESASVSNLGNIEVNSSGSVVFDAAISNQAGKTITLLGGTLATPTLTNAVGGTVKGFGALSGNLVNAGSVEFYGPTNVIGDVANQAGATILVRNNQTLITGHTVNDGTIQTLQGTVIFEGGLTNNGAYLSDPSDNYFTDLSVSQTGYLVGEIGDNFLVSGNFVNNSTQNLLWNTNAASLTLTGVVAQQNMYLAGDDLGALTSGYSNNFAWGEFSLVLGSSVKMWDGNGDPGAALYVGLMELGGGLAQLANIESAYNIYYDASLTGNAYLNGQTYALNGGGSLIAAQAVPEAETYAMLLAGLGLVGFAARRRKNRIRI